MRVLHISINTPVKHKLVGLLCDSIKFKIVIFFHILYEVEKPIDFELFVSVTNVQKILET